MAAWAAQQARVLRAPGALPVAARAQRPEAWGEPVVRARQVFAAQGPTVRAWRARAGVLPVWQARRARVWGERVWAGQGVSAGARVPAPGLVSRWDAGRACRHG